LEEIPKVAIEVFEHGDYAVGLFPRLTNKDDAPGFVPVIIVPEIIGVQK
jgi:hypothetical protein